MSSRKSVDLFRELARIPSLKCGFIRKGINKNNFVVSTTWTQRDLDRNEVSHFSRCYAIGDQEIIKLHPVELNNEQWNVASPSGRYAAVIRKLKDKKSSEPRQYLEIWSYEAKLQNLDVHCLEQHGSIYDDDSVFGSVKWSPSEGKLLYIAEERQAKARPFFKQGSKLEAEVEGDVYLYKETWGEQMIDKSKPVLCILDVNTYLISVLNWLPQNFSYGQAIWGADDKTIYLIGWYNDPYRLGIIYCPIRRNVLLKVDLEKNTYSEIGFKEDGRSVSSPLLSPKGDKMVYIDARSGGPHMQCNRLILQELHHNNHKVILDVITSPKPDAFPGLHCPHPHNKFWSRDNMRLIIPSHWRSQVELLVINTKDQTVKKISTGDIGGSWKVLHVDEDDNILACCSSINKSDQLLLGRLPVIGHEEEIQWKVLDGPAFDGQEKLKWSVVAVSIPKEQVNKDFDRIDYEYILVEPQNANNKPPLLVFNHGGPHSVVSTGFSHLVAGYCLSGMMVLLVNYRGSFGFGQDNIDSLLGNIGTQDVFDIKHVVDCLIREKKVDELKLAVTGGSHGGFLTCHLIGQFPELFQVAVVRNPVFNLTTLLGTSDIPDWVYTEVGLDFKACQLLDAQKYSLLYSKSPIAHVSKVKTPILFLLGAKDQRVPPSQGIQCYKILKSQSIPTRLVLYPDSSHPLSEVEAESDAFVNSLEWMNFFLKLE